MSKSKVIIGITGASGAIYGKLVIDKLAALGEQIDGGGIIFTQNAPPVWKYELGSFAEEELPFQTYRYDDYFAPMASGSAGYDVMIVCPCTMGTLGRIASGVSTDLLTRAADVMLKERKKLILVPRETPYSLIHLNNMKLLTEAGAIICPASPSFYSKPATLEELANTLVDRVLTLAGFKIDSYRWGQ